MSNGKSKMGATRAFLTLFEEQENCDVFFQIGSDTIGAQKGFLQARSQVLYELASAAHEKPIPIDGLSFEAFKAVLSYIYSDEIKITNNNVFDFLCASKTYKMAHLESLCAGFISSSLQQDTLCFYMNQAVDFNATALQDECQKIFSEKTDAILYRPEFLGLSQPALSSFLNVKSVDVLEIDLFLRVKDWMGEQCKKQGLEVNGPNMRRVIGDALYKIHFPAMTMLDFSNDVTTIEGLLSDHEMLQTFRKISVLKNKDIQCPFPSNFRFTSKEQLANNYSLVGHGLINFGTGTWYSMYKGFEICHNQGRPLSKKFVQNKLQLLTDLINTNFHSSSIPGYLGKGKKDDCWNLVKDWKNAIYNCYDLNTVMLKVEALQKALADISHNNTRFENF